MNFIKQWTLTVSTTLIISIIFSILSPKGNMGRFFKVILAMFIFVSFIYPVDNAHFDFSLPEFNEAQYYDEQLQAYENTFSIFIENELEKGGYNSSQVIVSLTCDDELIDIQSLEIYITDDYNKNDVKQYLLDETGFNAEVYYLGE